MGQYFYRLFFLMIIGVMIWTVDAQNQPNQRSDFNNCTDLLSSRHICLHPEISLITNSSVTLWGDRCERSSISCSTKIAASLGQRITAKILSYVPRVETSDCTQNKLQISEKGNPIYERCEPTTDPAYKSRTHELNVSFLADRLSILRIEFQVVGCKDEDIISGDNIRVNSEAFYGQSGNYTVQIICDEGYLIKDTNLTQVPAQCTAEGDNYQWEEPVRHQCEAASCTAVPLSNGSYSPIKLTYEYGEVITYNCTAGFKLTGESKARCTVTNGLGAHWNPLPQCTIVDCGKPDIAGANFTHPDSTTYLSQFNYWCNNNDTGPLTATCQGDGKWSYSPCPNDESVVQSGLSMKTIFIIVGVIVAVIFLILIIIAIVACMRNKRSRREPKNTNNNGAHNEAVGDDDGETSTMISPYAESSPFNRSQISTGERRPARGAYEEISSVPSGGRGVAASKNDTTFELAGPIGDPFDRVPNAFTGRGAAMQRNPPRGRPAAPRNDLYAQVDRVPAAARGTGNSNLSQEDGLIDFVDNDLHGT